MKLKNIKIDKLFGIYDYDIDMFYKEYVTILHAPNGMGKTTVLKMVKAIINGDILFLDETPFLKAKLTFDNGDYIYVSKKNVFETIFDKDFKNIRNLYYHDSDFSGVLPVKYSIKSKDKKIKHYEVKLNGDIMLMLSRRIPPRYRTAYNGGEEVVISFKDFIADEEFGMELFENPELYEMLNEYQIKLPIHIIEANRIFKSLISDDIRKRARERLTQVDSIRVYTNELKEIMDSRKKEKEVVSEVLDRTFPKRILDLFLHSTKRKSYEENTIKEQLNELERKRVELEKIGLIVENESADLSNELEFPKETLSILNLYIEDNTKKLEVYNDLKDKLEILLKIINERNGFSNKKMKIHSEMGVEFILDNGNIVPLEKLSSGEKNDFILFYELIFKCHSNSLILIDEPEISLHIAWQQEFINELLEICKMNNMQAIVATHSPNIVDEHWDLLKDMMGKEEEL